MSSKSLPAFLQQALEDHVNANELSNDPELQRIFDRLSRLNDNVEKIKRDILLNRAKRNGID
ncbi:hypothetical protein LJ739_02820 [Aestuariibacter halophilus]|uniref:Uncharacterized protein n=1 Tax=Fluctibacter halophilus TaxID=226011 RepID=A0ABS8G4W2_9ALTE|nr:hypothetical protein [Aestuariibacter halophilus]MCC2615176.1 hypothetical protein [Aestuariibacter halophilus]